MPTETRMGSLAPELEPPKPGCWIVRPEKPRWLLQLGGWGFILITCLNIGREFARQLVGRWLSWTLLAGFLLLVLGLQSYVALRDRFARRLRPEDSALIDGAFGDQYSAEITIVAGGKRLGIDRGIMWFADGLMGFSGTAATFVLAALDIVPFGEPTRSFKLSQTLPAGTLVLRGAPREAYVVIRPLGRQTSAYRNRLKAFVKADDPPSGERHWPPLEPYAPARDNEEGTSVAGPKDPTAASLQ